MLTTKQLNNILYITLYNKMAASSTAVDLISVKYFVSILSYVSLVSFILIPNSLPTHCSSVSYHQTHKFVRNVSDDKLRRFALSELMEHVVTPRHGSCSAHMSADARTPIGGVHRVNKPHANQPTTGLRRHGSAAAPRRQRGRAGACPASSVAALPSTWRASLGRLASPGTPRWRTVHGIAAAGIVLAPHEAGARTSAGARTKIERAAPHARTAIERPQAKGQK